MRIPFRLRFCFAPALALLAAHCGGEPPEAAPAASHLEAFLVEEVAGQSVELHAESCAGVDGPWTAEAKLSGVVSGRARLAFALEGQTQRARLVLANEGALGGALTGHVHVAPTDGSLAIGAELTLDTPLGPMPLGRLDRTAAIHAVATPCP